eukprot:4051404-Amphidinium_carterae.1
MELKGMRQANHQQLDPQLARLQLDIVNRVMQDLDYDVLSEVKIKSLTPEQIHLIIKTRWVIAERFVSKGRHQWCTPSCFTH